MAEANWGLGGGIGTGTLVGMVAGADSTSGISLCICRGGPGSGTESQIDVARGAGGGGAGQLGADATRVGGGGATPVVTGGAGCGCELTDWEDDSITGSDWTIVGGRMYDRKNHPDAATTARIGRSTAKIETRRRLRGRLSVVVSSKVTPIPIPRRSRQHSVR